MRPDLVWYHVIWNTHNSWLPGDPRGFRNHDHRIHSSGDYKSPPPAGEHEGLLRYNQARTGPPVRVPRSLHATVAAKVFETIAEYGGQVAAISVASEHVHVLAELPTEYSEAKAIVGKCKTYSSLSLRDALPEVVWARGCLLKRIKDQAHHAATRRYILEKQEPGASVWDQAPSGTTVAVAESTARAVASVPPMSASDATAQAVDSNLEPLHSFRDIFQQSDAIEVRRVTNRGKGGRAVIARRDIKEGELIERVPVLLIPRTQVFGPGDVAQRAARISWYVFEWLPTKRGYVALSLGYGSIYNHSDTPNAAYDMEPPDVMLFVATRDIAAGEEILISYAGAAGVMKELGFEASKDPPQATEGETPPAAG